jgi:hypothetical protein
MRSNAPYIRCYAYRAFAYDVTAAMLVFQFKIILINSFVWNTNMAAMAFDELVPAWEWVQTLYGVYKTMYTFQIQINRNLFY